MHQSAQLKLKEAVLGSEEGVERRHEEADQYLHVESDHEDIS
jgi:hypothetical protein